MHNNSLPIFTKFGGMVTHGPQNKPLDFGGNLRHVTLWLGLQLGGVPLHGRICES